MIFNNITITNLVFFKVCSTTGRFNIEVLYSGREAAELISAARTQCRHEVSHIYCTLSNKNKNKIIEQL
jgi:hypothetical protein